MSASIHGIDEHVRLADIEPLSSVYEQAIATMVGSDCSTPRAAQDGLTFASLACTAYAVRMQYTIRGIPSAVDAALRQRARAAGKSLNEAAVDALTDGAGMAGTPRRRRDLGDIAGSWRADKALGSALADQDLVDEDLWRWEWPSTQSRCRAYTRHQA